jgi:glutamine synthetase
MYAQLEGKEGEELQESLHELLREMLKEHKRILFSGNGYTEEWVEEAARRGLDNLKSVPECMPRWISQKNIDLFTGHGVLTKEEIFSRYEILLENYSKEIHIESLTMQEMIRKDFVSGLVAYMNDLSKEALQKKQLLPQAGGRMEASIIMRLDEASGLLMKHLEQLETDTKDAEKQEDVLASAEFYQKVVLKDMEALRSVADAAEALIPEQYLPYPTYGALLFSVR